MVTRQRLRVGASYAGKIVTVHVEDTHFRVTCDGAEISLHPKRRAAPRHPVESQDPRPEDRNRVQHLLSPSGMW
jgi:hypothetical protein